MIENTNSKTLCYWEVEKVNADGDVGIPGSANVPVGFYVY